MSLQYNITYRQKDKGWQYIVSVKENSKWKYKTSKQGFRTKALAKLAADKKVDELKETDELKKENDDKLPPELEKITFKDFMTMYVKHKEIHREYSTVSSIHFAWKKFTDLNDLPIEDITSLHTQNCVDKMVKEELSYNTVKTYMALIGGAFNYGITRKIIKDNPIENLTVPEDKESNEIKVLETWELDDLLSKLKNKRYRMIAMIAGTCGLRLGEIIGLKWDCVNFKDATITVNKQWKEIAKGKWGYGPVKRKNSNRTVPIPPRTLSAFERYKEDIPTHISNRIFYQNRSTKSLGEDMGSAFKRVGYDITVHGLRHTYATTLIANGVDFKTVAKLMGHDVEQTIKTYSHVTDSMMNKATNVLKKAFN